MRNFLIKCNEANHICDKSQYKEASFFEKLKLNLHLLFCGFCRKYSKNNVKLSNAIKDSNVDCIEESKKKEMQKTFEKELAKHHHKA